MAETSSPFLRVRCPNCGSPAVRFDAGKQKLVCSHCGHGRDLPKNRDRIQERPLSEDFSTEGQAEGLALETKAYECEQCGSQVSVAADQVKVDCAFCGAVDLHEAAQASRIVQPSAVLPFSFPRAKAEAAFWKWIKKGWFHPRQLAKEAKVEQLHGVYIPFWTFDALTRSTWHAEVGHVYWIEEKYPGEGEEPESRRVQKIRWQPASGYFEHFFDDLIVPASHTLSSEETKALEPFDLEKLVDYDSRYVLGWECELYQKDLQEGLKEAEKQMETYIQEQVESRINGDTHRELEIQTEKEGLTFKHILLPIWIAGYTYNGSTFRFLINGRSGEVTGEKPRSWLKVTAAWAAGVGAFVLAAILAAKYLG